MGTSQWSCSACGTPNAPTQRFCGNCGTPHQAAQPGAGPQPAPPQPRGGFPTWGWFAIGGGALAVVAAILVVVLISGSDEPEVVVPPLASGEPLPSTAPVDPEYEALVAQLPAEITGCQPSTSTDPTASAAALCVAPGRPDVAAHFTLYSSPEAAQGAYDLVITSEGGAFDTGDCATGVVGEEGWSGGGGSGRLLCNTEPDVQVFWSTDGSPVLGLLNGQPGTPLTDLYAVWQSVPVY